MRRVPVRITRLADAPLPRRQTPDSAGLDLHAAMAATVPARGYTVVGCGIAIELPRGYEAQVRPRSGIAAEHGIGILNSPGTVDSDFRGEIKVLLFNVSDKDYVVSRGDRIAQLVFGRTVDVEFLETRVLDSSDRGEGGLGHTGR